MRLVPFSLMLAFLWIFVFSRPAGREHDPAPRLMVSPNEYAPAVKGFRN